MLKIVTYSNILVTNGSPVYENRFIPGTDGGANKVSFIAKRKRSKASHVSRSITVDSWATASIVLKTL